MESATISIKSEPADNIADGYGQTLTAKFAETCNRNLTFSGYVRRSGNANKTSHTQNIADAQPTCESSSQSGILQQCSSLSSEVAVKEEPVDLHYHQQLCNTSNFSTYTSDEIDTVLHSKLEPCVILTDFKPEVMCSDYKVEDMKPDVKCEDPVELLSTDLQRKGQRQIHKNGREDLKVVHFCLSLPNGSVTERLSYRCRHCGKTSTDHEMMERHCVENSTAAAACKNKSELRCQTCSKRFKRPCSRQEHEKEGHSSQRSYADPRPFLCDCRRRFRSKVYLDLHQRYKCLYEKRAVATADK